MKQCDHLRRDIGVMDEFDSNGKVPISIKRASESILMERKGCGRNIEKKTEKTPHGHNAYEEEKDIACIQRLRRRPGYRTNTDKIQTRISI
jgi:predicted MarR family transcription regulator